MAKSQMNEVTGKPSVSYGGDGTVRVFMSLV